MNTVIFNDGIKSWNSYTDLNLILTSKIIGSPTAKVETVDIPGGNGVLDFTEFFGETKYNNRTLTFEFTCINPAAMKDSTTKNLLHGKKMKIFLSEDSSFYFYGRINVGDWEVDKKIATVTITCDCEPYRYKNNETVKTITYGTPTSNNVCPSFGFWGDTTDFKTLNEDTAQILAAAKSRKSPQIIVFDETKINIHFDECGRYYVNEYNSSGSVVKSTNVQANNFTTTLQTTTSFVCITLQPTSGSTFPVTYKNLMVTFGDDSAEVYSRYDGGTILWCDNSTRSVVPVITTNDDVQLTCNNVSTTVSAGAWTIPEFELKSGTNKIVLSETDDGTVVTARYQEADL